MTSEQGIKDMFTKEDIACGLTLLGLTRGDMVYVHSSLKKIGYTENGPDTVIDAILDVIGADGTMAVPTHSMNYPGFIDAPYDKKTSPGVQMGIISETLRKRAGALRSDHPTHSTAAIGKKAEILTKSHCLHDPFAENSPIFRVYENGGKILLLGVNHDRNTAIHLSDEILHMPYNGIGYNVEWSDNALIQLENGDTMTIRQTNYPGHSGRFVLLEGMLYFNNLVRYGIVGSAVSMLMNAKDVVDFATKIVQKKPDFLLCHDPQCSCCGRRREHLETLGWIK